MALTDDQVLRWFGPPVTAIRKPGIPLDIPKALHSDWRLLKSFGYTEAEARRAIEPSWRKLSTPQPNADEGDGK